MSPWSRVSAWQSLAGRMRDLMGWGSDWSSLLWGSYGFASLSMGRDRYAEYSAQRIASASRNSGSARVYSPASARTTARRFKLLATCG